MARKWFPRLIATGALALALGCRSEPTVPVCTTPLFPEDVVRLRQAPRPAVAATPATGPTPHVAKRPDEPPPVVPPRDVTATLTSRSKPVAPAIKPLPADAAEPVLRLPDPRPAPAAAETPLKPGEKSGHGPDYRWVAGTLDRHLKGGFWTLRYADIGEDDPWGGKVRLLDGDRLKDLRDGDVVYVEGDLLAPASAAETAAYPPYRVTKLTVIERAK